MLQIKYFLCLRPSAKSKGTNYQIVAFRVILTKSDLQHFQQSFYSYNFETGVKIYQIALESGMVIAAEIFIVLCDILIVACENLKILRWYMPPY